jgi:glucosamine-6-phosphate deaminase
MPAFVTPPTLARSLELSGASVLVFEDAASACHHAADRIATVIDEAVGFRGKAVLGLATGGTPLPVYARLVERFDAGTLSFRQVSSYNLDEYYPIHPSDPNSYRSYMHRHLFGRVDLAPNHAHVLDGTVPEAFAQAHAAEYDRWIEADGGLDLQLLGIGRNGHIGFNEPTDLPLATALALPTRLVELHPVTIADAARDFGSEDQVIRRALTVGVAPILAAREILILAFGPQKAEAVAGALTGPVSPRLPATLLRRSSARVTWLLDPAAARGLG